MAIAQLYTCDEGKRGYELLSPVNLKPIGRFECAQMEDIDAVVKKARDVQSAWHASGFRERATCLDRLRQVIVERKREIAETICLESGKPKVEALSEIAASCDSLQYYAKHADRILRTEKKRLHLFWPFKKLVTHFHPLGVVGIITPWNVSFAMGINPTAQALMSGNTVILKPSKSSLLSGHLIEDLFQSAGFPEGVFQILPGDGQTGNALCEAHVDKIHFTGSVRVGRIVGEICGRRLIPCTLELGGKDPAIVCEDADMERTVPGVIYAAFFNAGQACASTERVYVIDAIYDEFVSRVKDEVEKLNQQSLGAFDIGPMIVESQLSIVQEHVAEAIKAGAVLLSGGCRNPDEKGLYYKPTVLTEVSHTMRVMTEETFGPVLPIIRVKDEEEAVRMANDTRFGLSASVWTKNIDKGIAIAGRLNSGGAAVNEFGGIVYGAAEGSFGGRAESGIGRINGESGLKSFCREQNIVVHRFGPKKERVWFPYTGKTEKIMEKIINIFWGTPLGRWIS